MMQGQIIEGRGGLYTVRDAAGIDHVLRAKKKFRRQHMTPLVGDRVDFTPGEGDEHGLLREKRRSRRENDGAGHRADGRALREQRHQTEDCDE